MTNKRTSAWGDWFFALLVGVLITIAFLSMIPPAHGAEPPLSGDAARAELEKRTDKIIEKIDAKNAELGALRTENEKLRSQNSQQNIQVQYLQILAERNELGMRVLQLSGELKDANVKIAELQKQLDATQAKPPSPPVPPAK